MFVRTILYRLLLIALCFTCFDPCFSQNRLQEDTVFFLAHKKGLLGKLGRAVSIRGQEDIITENKGAIKNEAVFRPYRGKIIRQIRVEKLSFDNSVNDTTRSGNRLMNNISDALYTGTTNKTILRNLFFVTGDTLYPYLMADNERFLRELSYLQDAKILVTDVREDPGAVDVVIRWKDLFPIGGSAEIGSATSMSLELNNDNLFGSGDRIQFRGLYDMDRKPDFGSGIEYIKRNVGGSFLNLAVGFQTQAPAFNSGRREEKALYVRGELPLVSPYHRWTGGFEVGKHLTNNSYITDSVYKAGFKYNYRLLDGWLAFNIGARKQLKQNLTSRLKRFVGLRGVQRLFNDIPEQFKTTYNYYYSNVEAVLGSFTLFEQDYYHTNFLYGFGRNEDVPEGFSLSLLGGWVRRNNIERPYIGFDYQREYFSDNKNYVNYTIRFGTYFNKDQFEDISGLTSVEYFTRLRKISGSNWFSRHFLSGSVTQQVRTVLNEPLRLTSIFGIPELNTNLVRASTRISANCESVFYNTSKTFGFSFAPFVFTNMTYLKTIGQDFAKGDIYTSFGTGVRTRNENLVFGTMELKLYYYPRTTGRMTPWNLTFNTGLRFKYNSQLLRKPDFIQVN
jgi:hypothetical protein